MARDCGAPPPCTRRAGPHHLGAGRGRVNRSGPSGIEMNEKLLSELSARLAELAAAEPGEGSREQLPRRALQRLHAPGAGEPRGIRRAVAGPRARARKARRARGARGRARGAARIGQEAPLTRPHPAGSRGAAAIQGGSEAVRVAVVYSRGLAGLDAPLVRVEAHVGNGLPAFHIVGLPETEVKEARDRVRAALQTARFEFPQRRITVNLAPADLPKESGRFDLPIAHRHPRGDRSRCPASALGALEFAGELALSGELRPIRGALAMTFGAHRDGRAFVLPESSGGRGGARARRRRSCPRARCSQVCAHLSGATPLVAAMPGAARRVRAGLRRPGRRARPAASATRARDRGGRRPLDPARRAARHRQDDARHAHSRASCPP